MAVGAEAGAPPHEVFEAFRRAAFTRRRSRRLGSGRSERPAQRSSEGAAEDVPALFDPPGVLPRGEELWFLHHPEAGSGGGAVQEHQPGVAAAAAGRPPVRSQQADDAEGALRQVGPAAVRSGHEGGRVRDAVGRDRHGGVQRQAGLHPAQDPYETALPAGQAFDEPERFAGAGEREQVDGPGGHGPQSPGQVPRSGFDPRPFRVPFASISCGRLG